MKVRFSLILCLLTAVPVLCRTPSAPDIAGITAAYEGLNTAFQAHDLERFMGYFSPDYIDIDENGKHLTKDETRSSYQAQLRQMKTMQSRYVVKSVTTTPQGTLVEMEMHSHGTGEKRVLFVRIRGHFTDDLWVRDLWVTTPQGWRLQHRLTLRDDLRMGR